jgi:hypothetical protein
MDDSQVWETERRLWLEGADVYGELLDPECLMAFPGMGVMRADDVLKSLESAPRWKSVEMIDRAVGRPGDSVLVLGYAAVGHRDGAPPYRCLCTSTYRCDGSAWKLIQHQQTPATAPEAPAKRGE